MKETIETIKKIIIILKAWEILKNKEIDIFFFNRTTDVKQYNEYCTFPFNIPNERELTQEEYKTIKELMEVAE